MTYAESGLFWSQCFLPSLVIRKAQAGAGKSSLGLLWFYMANPAYDVTKITDNEIKINPRWWTANYFKSKYFKK